MSIPDPVEGTRRLQTLYARMYDDELLALAEDGSDLTDAAREALQSELANRHLILAIKETPPDEPSGDFDLPPSELASVARVWNINEARQHKTILDAAGIPSYFGPDNVDDLSQLPSNFDREIEVKVWERQQQYALGALGQGLPQDPADQQQNAACEIQCPKCHSTEIVFEGLDGDASGTSTPDSKYNWSCDACGNQWKDDGVEV